MESTENDNNVREVITRSMQLLTMKEPSTSAAALSVDTELTTEKMQVPIDDDLPCLDFDDDVADTYGPGVTAKPMPIIFDHTEYIAISLKTVWHSFQEVPTSQYIRKKLIQNYYEDGEMVKEDSIVNIRHAQHLDLSEHPTFGSSKMHSEVVDLWDENFFPSGLRNALLTMRVGEYSQFVISHEEMYGDNGLPYYAPPKAWWFLHIRVLSLVSDDATNCGDTIFSKAMASAKNAYVSANKCFKDRDYRSASSLYHKARRLMNCRLVNGQEEEMRDSFLTKVLLNSVVCENKLKRWQLACHLCKELNLLGRLFTNEKALYQNAKAHLALGSFWHAKRYLMAGLRLSPNNKEILMELKKLREKKSECENYKKKIEEYGCEKYVDDDKFSKAIEDICLQLINDQTATSTRLPDMYSEAEVDIVIKHAIDFGLLVDIGDDNIFTLLKRTDDTGPV